MGLECGEELQCHLPLLTPGQGRGVRGQLMALGFSQSKGLPSDSHLEQGHKTAPSHTLKARTQISGVSHHPQRPAAIGETEAPRSARHILSHSVGPL